MTIAPALAPVTTRPVPRPGYPAFESCFAPEPINVGRSRHTTSVFLRLCEVADPLAEDVVLCVSELVTNGVTHGSGDLSLRVRCRETEILVEVQDGSSVSATMRSASADATSGRGLVLVKALSGDWGASADGRTTWCTFPILVGRP
ncbi:ATP-binding protein [Streptomyces sp. NPDC048430]|uniref:ATP-binding protein n=1 Tax=Streptomyces sp. NPDC048430 TaxID=3155388 RepID=UPI00342AA50C